MDSILFWIRIWTNYKYFSAMGVKPIDTKFRVVKSGGTTYLPTKYLIKQKHRKIFKL